MAAHLTSPYLSSLCLPTFSFPWFAVGFQDRTAIHVHTSCPLHAAWFLIPAIPSCPRSPCPPPTALPSHCFSLPTSWTIFYFTFLFCLGCVGCRDTNVHFFMGRNTMSFYKSTPLPVPIFTMEGKGRRQKKGGGGAGKGGSTLTLD